VVRISLKNAMNVSISPCSHTYLPCPREDTSSYLKPKRRFSEYNLKDMTLAIALVDYSD
jgi:hypothetical protein